jgi:protoporphyrinogen oxidase
MNVKYIIIGAGPAGLTFAATLKKSGETSFVILEKEAEAGGLCRSTLVDGTPIDVGGGHILDARNKDVVAFIFSYMPETEWNLFSRKSNIQIGKTTIDYPFEANIWQFPMEDQIDYLESIARAALAQGEKPEHFVDWIYWKLGDKIAETYMIPYNQKLWSIDLNMMGTYWLEKLPNVSFRDTLASCLSHKFFGKYPGHAQFYYPKKQGYGEAFLRIADSLKENIRYNYPVEKLDIEKTTVNDEFTGEIIINTAPWMEFSRYLPEHIETLVNKLQYASVDLDYFPEHPGTDAHWTYLADAVIPYHRRYNQENVAAGSKGYWVETNAKRRQGNGSPYGHFENKYSYPLHLLDKPKVIGEVLAVMKTHNIIGLGRWGEWDHYNSDVVMEKAMKLAETLLKN